MNDILQFLNTHGSVRQFTDQPITEEEERTILTTAIRSPTSSNLHAYSIIGVRDQTRKDQLAKLSGGQNHVARSALFLVFCADLFRLSNLNKKRGYPFNGEFTEMMIIAVVDATLVAGRALMAAQGLGIGGVMVGGLRSHIEEVSELLKLPKQTFPVMGLSLGYPVESPVIKPRLPMDALYFSEQYRPEQMDNAIEEYDRTILELGYLKGREVDPEHYPGFDDKYSWSEHTARRMASNKPSVRRDHMKAYLEKRGFMLK